MAGTSEAENAVRNYLVFIEDPSRLVDQGEVQRLELLVKSADDPLERLLAMSRLDKVRAGDADGYRRAFCDHAKAWAESEGIRAASFLEMGVDTATLRAAGFAVKAAASSSSPARASRRGQVRVEEVKAAVRGQRGQFTMADVAVAVGGASPMTIRKAIDELVTAGEVERLGPTPNWSQPGRAPILFRLRKRALRSA